MPVATEAAAPPRWASLDSLRGLALWLMVAHHLASWTGGHVGDRFVGFEGFVVTDLAAPLFAVSLGAGAALAGGKVRDAGSVDRRRLLHLLGRWGQVLALGLAIDVAVGGGIDGGGVLPTLAVAGATITVLAVAGTRAPLAWAALAVAASVAVIPLTSGHAAGFGGELLGGRFALPTYLVFAAGGAAVVAAAPAGERHLPLLRAASVVVVLGIAAAALDPTGLAPDGIWPPTRYPGDLAFTVWGLSVTFVLWAAVRRWLPSTSTALGRGLARAGQRTLLVFGIHYLLKLGLQYSGRLGTLDTRAWGWATWVAVVAVCWLSARPLVRERNVRGRHPRAEVALRHDEIARGPALRVVRAGTAGAARTGATTALLPPSLPAGSLRGRPAPR